MRACNSLPQSNSLWTLLLLLCMAAPARAQQAAPPGQWPQFGGTGARNNAPAGKGLPIQWDVKKRANIAWTADLGNSVASCPVIAKDRVLMGTNNSRGYLPRVPADTDAATLLCFDKDTGNFLWQYVCERHPRGRVFDWPCFGMMSAPCVQGDRVWVLNNRCQLICLDLQGFADEENDGVRDEEAPSGQEADVVWRLDLIGQLQVHPHNVNPSSPTIAGNLVLINTGNGVDETHNQLTAPHAPSFLAVDKRTGKVVWQSNLPGSNVLHGQWSSPAWSTIGGVQQAIFAGGDGWVYSFSLEDMRMGKTKLLWRFDANPKRNVWRLGGQGNRNNIIAAPLVHGDRVYIATGQDPEHGEGEGMLWCIDATKRGDISAELVYNRESPGKLVPHKRNQACDEDAGDFTRPNPNTGVIWSFRETDRNQDGKLDHDEAFHRAIATPVIAKSALGDSLLVAVDTSGYLHCLDAQTGKPHWVYDLFASATSTPVLVDGKIYVGDEDGEITVLQLDRRLKVLGEVQHERSIVGTLVSAGNALYVPQPDQLLKVQWSGDQGQ